jgi:hypothetical protein
MDGDGSEEATRSTADIHDTTWWLFWSFLHKKVKHPGMNRSKKPPLQDRFIVGCRPPVEPCHIGGSCRGHDLILPVRAVGALLLSVRYHSRDQAVNLSAAISSSSIIGETAEDYNNYFQTFREKVCPKAGEFPLEKGQMLSARLVKELS